MFFMNRLVGLFVGLFAVLELSGLNSINGIHPPQTAELVELVLARSS